MRHGRQAGRDAPELGGWEAAQDRFTAATIAYGHQGTFTDLSFRGAPADVKTFYLLGPLQRRYAMRRAAAIAYHDPATGKLLGTSDAVRSGVSGESQVYVLRLEAKALALPAEAKVTSYDADGNGAPVAALVVDGWLELPVAGETVRFEVR